MASSNLVYDNEPPIFLMSLTSLKEVEMNGQARRTVGTRELLKAEIGDEFGPFETRITEEMVERSTWANDDYNPWYLEDSPFGGRIASPMFLSLRLQNIFWSHYAIPSGGALHTSQEFDFISPLRIGKKIIITGKLVERYHRRGRDSFVAEYLAVDEDGAEIVRMRRTETTPVVVSRPNKKKS